MQDPVQTDSTELLRTLIRMGHTDVVPVNASGWSRDPFGAEV
jgi:acetylornithine deacetylase/succinyl-diaminopimelate desuccinylase-like protein